MKAIIDATELFPSELLDAMVPDAVSDSDVNTDPQAAVDTEASEFWLIHDDGNGPTGIAYCAPEAMTNGTWNLLLIAVHPDQQGHGVGTRLMSYVESRLSESGERILLVETSGTDDFEQTRRFYSQRDYQQEARIRDYYDADDDKIIFWKAL